MEEFLQQGVDELIAQTGLNPEDVIVYILEIYW